MHTRSSYSADDSIQGFVSGSVNMLKVLVEDLRILENDAVWFDVLFDISKACTASSFADKQSKKSDHRWLHRVCYTRMADEAGKRKEWSASHCFETSGTQRHNPDECLSLAKVTTSYTCVNTVT